MPEIRRGYALLLTAGDPEISAALADGIARGREAATGASSAPPGRIPREGRLGEGDWERVAELLKVAMHPEPVDYAGKAFDAEMAYGESVYFPGPMRKIGERLLLWWALATLAVIRFFEWEERKWRRS